MIGLVRVFCGERELLGSYVLIGDFFIFRFKLNFWNIDDGFKLFIILFYIGKCRFISICRVI